MYRDRQTRIVATLGPASDTPEMIEKLFLAGVDMFRLNFSHGKNTDHIPRVEIIRELEKKHGRPIAIMADLQGPKLRIGTFENNSIELTQGTVMRFDLDKTPGNKERVCLPHPEILDALDVGGLVFLDDGKVRAKVVNKGSDYIEAKIEAGSKLSNRKGLNIPNVILPIPALTEKDRADLPVALDAGVDWVAQSFVQTPEDVELARKLIGGRAALMVKLEKPSALVHLEEIIALADGAMLARGDLGVEIPAEDVPAAQKRVIRHLREQGKPIVVATQMLESMIDNPRPTRAEASDVATAVYDGTDAVMLSAETAAGQYPIRAVEIMDKICKSTERDETYIKMMDANHPTTGLDSGDAITTASTYVAQDVEAKALVCYTTSGSTALRMSRHRPEIPILCLTPKIDVARRLCVSYGIISRYHEAFTGNFSDIVEHASRIVTEVGVAQKDDLFVMTAGVPFGVKGTTNTLRIVKVAV